MTFRSLAAIPAVIVPCLVCSPAPGQDISEPPPTAVQPLVVTPTRVATPIDAQASSVTLITAEEIDAQQWRTIPDALQTAPGLSVTQTGGPGGLTSVFIRGLNSDHVKVLIDGVDAEDPSVGGFDFGQQLTSGLARVEILRGPASSLYGSDALGGVINIITAPGEGPPHLSATLEGGSFDTLNETARLAGGGPGADYAFEFAHLFAGDTPVTPRGLLSPGETLVGDRYDNYTFGLKADVTATPWLGFGLSARYLTADLRNTGEDYDEIPVGPDAAQTDQYERALFTRAEARLTNLDGALKNVFGVAYTFYHTVIQAPDDGYPPPAPVFDFGDRLRGDWQGTLSLVRWADLVAGADIQRDRLIDSPIDAQDARQGGFVEVQARPTSRLSIAASVRYDHDDQFGGATTWRIAPEWTAPLTGTILRATYGTGFKAPTLQQLYVSYPDFDFHADAGLKPERSTGWDAGFEQPVGPARFGATWFHNQVRDLIDDNADYTSYANIDRATTYGLESFAAWRVSNALTVRADYTYTFTRNDDPGYGDQELLRRPKDKASLTAQWRPARRLTLAANWLYKGGWVDGSRDFSVPRLWASPYSVTNVSGSYELTRGVSVFARIENLFDRRYEDPVGFDRPGIGVFGGVRFDLAGASAFGR